MGKRKVSAIVPAYNEAPRIARVLDVLATHPDVMEVIVVDDGSTDGTSEVAERSSARVFRHEHNRGKGTALARGVRAAQSPFLFFCDADLVGLTHNMVSDIVTPVVRGEVELFVGCRDRTRSSLLRNLFIVLPLLEGQRALTRALWERVPDELKQRFEVETAINFFAVRSGGGLGAKVFPSLSQISKEEKYGLACGVLRRYAMYIQIVRANKVLHSRYASDSQ